MISIFRAQVNRITGRWAYHLSAGIILVLTAINFALNCLRYSGYDFVEMVDPLRVMIVSSGGSLNGIYMQLFPVLIVIASGSVIFHDRMTRMKIFIALRKNGSQYYAGTMLAVFFTTFILFLLPALLEYILTWIAFPIEATGDPGHVVPYITMVAGPRERGYLFFPIFFSLPKVYPLVMIVRASAVFSMLSVFTNCIASIGISFRILLLVPVYAVLSLFNFVLPMIQDSYFTFNDYLTLYLPLPMAGWEFAAVMAGLVLLSLGITVYQSRSDQIL